MKRATSQNALYSKLANAGGVNVPRKPDGLALRGLFLQPRQQARIDQSRGALRPTFAPDPAEWLATDEAERIGLVVEYHRGARVKLPNQLLHATIHVVVESQVAMGDELPVRRVLERLQAEGLDRHDAIHAVGSVLAGHMYDLLRTGAPKGDPNQAYWRELDSLTAESWRRFR